MKERDNKEFEKELHSNVKLEMYDIWEEYRIICMEFVMQGQDFPQI